MGKNAPKTLEIASIDWYTRYNGALGAACDHTRNDGAAPTAQRRLERPPLCKQADRGTRRAPTPACPALGRAMHPLDTA